LGFLLAIAHIVGGCSSSAPEPQSGNKVYAPEDMPEICQDIDFNHTSEDIKEICGVQTRNYRAYRNIPEHRNLLMPKGGKIVRKGKGLELRLQNTLPVPLPSDFDGKIQFDEKLRRKLIKSRMDYCEFFPGNSDARVRIIKLDIPLDAGGEKQVCYTIESGPVTEQRKVGYAGRLEHLDCGDFQHLKEKAKAGVEETPPSEDVQGEDTDAPRPTQEEGVGPMDEKEKDSGR